jgi:alanyl-tRNA synthetase
MSTSQRRSNPPAPQPADQGSAMAADAADTGELPVVATEGPALPEDEQELREEIEQTRQQLGQTVEQLAAKADAKGRAQAKAAQLTGRVKAKAAQGRASACRQGAGVRSEVASTALTARQKAAAAKDQLRSQMAPAWEAAPEPVRRTVATAASTAKQQRVPLAVAGATLIAGYLALRRWRKR